MVANNEYEQFRDWLEKSSGILLGDNKQYLVKSRLRKIMAEHGLSSLTALVEAIRKQPRSGLKEAVVDAMTTNETLWFRDNHPFRILEEKLLPELAAEKTVQPIRIWSAACSTGQEPYSIAMIIAELKKRNPALVRRQVKIVATDLSGRVLEIAKRGEYEMLAIGRGLSRERLAMHFDEVDSGVWKVKPEIQRMVEFRPLNLKDSYALLGKFDIIFCRNVLIYFSADLKTDILRRMHATLKPGGYLMLGASESLSGLQDKFEMVHCRPGIVYRAK
ncbi:MAG: protein-glutamate O-methyltransferase CheR [Gammaproteobacteria bacterium]|nr:MAG: protein-glutamate O-methyltransferase CheR [Gammaproteobacteria bacterium]